MNILVPILLWVTGFATVLFVANFEMVEEMGRFLCIIAISCVGLGCAIALVVPEKEQDNAL